MADEKEQDAIEADFVASWDWIERYYDFIYSQPQEWEGKKLVLNLISELRKRGFDRQLRAGQSLATFRLSRCRNHGLRTGQPTIAIDFNSNTSMSVRYYEQPDEAIQLQLERIELTAEIEELLQRLLAQPID